MGNIKGFRGRLDILIRDLAGGKENLLAKLLGIKPENINKWTNRGSLPSAEQLENISRKLNVDVNWLLTGEGERWKNPGAGSKSLNPYSAGEWEPEPSDKKVYWEGQEVSFAETGKRLKGIRGSLTLRQAADISGVSQPAIKNCEAGKQMPDVQYLYWAAGYGYTNATWIMTGENPQEERLAAEGKPRYGQPITPEEREVIDLYRIAPKDAQMAVRAILSIYREGGKK